MVIENGRRLQRIFGHLGRGRGMLNESRNRVRSNPRLLMHSRDVQSVRSTLSYLLGTNERSGPSTPHKTAQPGPNSSGLLEASDGVSERANAGSS